MSSLNQRILKTQRELLALMNEAKDRRLVGRTSAPSVVGKKLAAEVLAEANRRQALAKNDKRNKVKAGFGIRPAILDVLLKSRKELKRSELADAVAKRAPRGVSWSLGSCNMALAGLVKDRMIRKENTHGGKFSITKQGRDYARSISRERRAS